MSTGELERINFAFKDMAYLTNEYKSLRDVPFQIEILTRIYTIVSSFYPRFIKYPTAYNSKTGVANSRLWYVMYNNSFNHLKAIQKIECEGREEFRLVCMAYRKLYEKQRDEDWSTAIWKRRLPLGILNMISEYVY